MKFNMNKTLATILKIVGAVTVLAGIAAAVIFYLKKKGIICISCDCDCDYGDFEDLECDCDEECDDEDCCCQCAEEAPADAE